MIRKTADLRPWAQVLFIGLRRATRCLAGVAVAAASLLGAAMPAVAVTTPTLGVVVVGSGQVTSQPPGINCPGKCTATFAMGTSVALVPKPKNGSEFLGWGGSCTGTGACTVKMSSLAAVAAEFTRAAVAPPTPANNKPPISPGSYSGSGYVLYVSAGGTQVQDVSLAANYHSVLQCTPTNSFDDTSFYIPDITVAKDGSFSGKTTQTGVEDGSTAKFTDTVSGHFHGTDSSGDERAAGSLRENVTYNNGTAYSCTTGTQPWSMIRSGS
jgi:hypothetical protein